MFSFDHLVHFINEPEQVIEILKDKGIYVVEGGEHASIETYNTLSYFGLSYIEFCGITDLTRFKQLDHPKYSLMDTFQKDNFFEGFSRFAARTTDIEGVANHFREKGLTVVGPHPLSRKRPDGSVLTWQLLYAGNDDDSLQLPFIIQWDDDDEKRRADHVERGIITSHPAGVDFSHVTFAVRDLNDSVEKWVDWLDLTAGETYIDETLNATCQQLELPGGNLVFASPNGDGIVQDVLDTRGEKPFQVTLSGGKEEQTFELFGGRYQISK